MRGQESTLRLSDALARTAERNPALAVLGYGERAAEALIEQAGVRPNPMLEFEAENFGGTGTRQGVRELEATVRASQTIERGGKREKRVAAATRDREVAAAEYAVKRAELLGVAAVAFVETLVAQQRVAFAEQPIKLAREMLATAEGRARSGMASAAEPARARAALASARSELARAQSELLAARGRVAALWSGSPSDVPTLQGVLQLPAAISMIEGALLEKLSAHPRLAHQQAIVTARRAALEVERTHATQDITVAGGMRFLREGSDAALVAGISVPLPMRNRNQGSIRAARENLAGAEQAARAIEAELRTELLVAWREASSAYGTAQQLRREALPAALEAQAIVRRAYEQGQLPLIDVLDAQRELIAVQRELQEAETRFATAHARAEARIDPTLPLTSKLLSLP